MGEIIMFDFHNLKDAGHNSAGLEEEYQKILKTAKSLITANGRTREAINNHARDLKNRKEKIFDSIQTEMTRLALEDRALNELLNNWENTEYWDEPPEDTENETLWEKRNPEKK